MQCNSHPPTNHSVYFRPIPTPAEQARPMIPRSSVFSDHVASMGCSSGPAM